MSWKTSQVGDQVWLHLVWRESGGSPAQPPKHSGYRVRMASRVDKGRQLAESEGIDVALLDVNLAGEDSFPIAEKLRARHIPIMFASGYADASLLL